MQVIAGDLSTLSSAKDAVAWMKQQIGRTLFGVEHAVDDLLVALMAHGHILLEDVPGVGKTALAKTFSAHLGLTFHRIQCTPDLLPADIVGGLVFHPKEAEFVLRKGPVFANILLVDEINRALPRTQSALLEAMAEGQVTIDGEAHRLPQPFLVIATQNPIESQGVFPLPEAQLDRFLLKTNLGYPSESNDLSLLRLHLSVEESGNTAGTAEVSAREPYSSSNEDTSMQLLRVLDHAVAGVTITDDVLRYISALVRATRTHPDLEIGASPRAMILLAKAARAVAVVSGRDYVTPDDVQRVAPKVLFHRLVFQGHVLSTETEAQAWMDMLLKTVDVPIEALQS